MSTEAICIAKLIEVLFDCLSEDFVLLLQSFNYLIILKWVEVCVVLGEKDYLIEDDLLIH